MDTILPSIACVILISLYLVFNLNRLLHNRAVKLEFNRLKFQRQMDCLQSQRRFQLTLTRLHASRPLFLLAITHLRENPRCTAETGIKGRRTYPIQGQLDEVLLEMKNRDEDDRLLFRSGGNRLIGSNRDKCPKC